MAKLVASLEDDPGFINSRPVLVNLVDGIYQVYGGNQRVRAAKRLKWKEITCSVEENLTEELMKSRVIKDNQTYGEFDYDILANEYDIDMLLEAGMTLEQLSLDSVDVTTEEDEAVLEPKKDEDANTKLGDIYELNDHRIICGDSTNKDTVDKLLDGNKPILMVTDPPYGVNYDASWRKDIKGKHGVAAKALGKVKNDNKIDWSGAFNLFPGSIVYIWCASWFLPEVYKSIGGCGYEIKSLIIWVKQHFTLGRGDYHWHHEPCWYAVKKGCKHNWQGSRKETTVWEIQTLGDNYHKQKNDDDIRTSHSTQKPLECMAKPIRNNTAEGEGVYDPFIGSGTTLIACEQLARTCYGIELSPGYCDIIIERWINYMNKINKSFTVKKNGLEIEWKIKEK